jgi:hypothetical protein
MSIVTAQGHDEESCAARKTTNLSAALPAGKILSATVTRTGIYACTAPALRAQRLSTATLMQSFCFWIWSFHTNVHEAK